MLMSSSISAVISVHFALLYVSTDLAPRYFYFFFKQKTAYELRISDWSSDVCSSDLDTDGTGLPRGPGEVQGNRARVGDRRGGHLPAIGRAGTSSRGRGRDSVGA